MILDVLPTNLFNADNIEWLLRDGDSAILHKTLNDDLLDKQMYLSTAALLFVQQGRQIISNVDGDSQVVEQGQIVFLAKDLYLVSDFVANEGQFEALLFFVTDSVITKLTLLNPELKRNKSNQSIGILTANNQVNQYMASIINIYKQSENSEALLPIKINELLTLLSMLDGGQLFIETVYQYSLVSKKRDIRHFMEVNYAKNLTLEDYAQLTGRSVSTFIRDFKKLYDTTPNKWIVGMRLKKAHELLSNSNLNVTNTALEVGYENVSHFIDAYKSKYGVTPNQTKLFHDNNSV